MPVHLFFSVCGWTWDAGVDSALKDWLGSWLVMPLMVFVQSMCPTPCIPEPVYCLAGGVHYLATFPECDLRPGRDWCPIYMNGVKQKQQ